MSLLEKVASQLGLQDVHGLHQPVCDSHIEAPHTRKRKHAQDPRYLPFDPKTYWQSAQTSALVTVTPQVPVRSTVLRESTLADVQAFCRRRLRCNKSRPVALILKGAAGSGKTYLIEEACRRLKLTMSMYCVENLSTAAHAQRLHTSVFGKHFTGTCVVVDGADLVHKNILDRILGDLIGDSRGKAPKNGNVLILTCANTNTFRSRLRYCKLITLPAWTDSDMAALAKVRGISVEYARSLCGDLPGNINHLQTMLDFWGQRAPAHVHKDTTREEFERAYQSRPFALDMLSMQKYAPTIEETLTSTVELSDICMLPATFRTEAMFCTRDRWMHAEVKKCRKRLPTEVRDLIQVACTANQVPVFTVVDTVQRCGNLFQKFSEPNLFTHDGRDVLGPDEDVSTYQDTIVKYLSMISL